MAPKQAGISRKGLSADPAEQRTYNTRRDGSHTAQTTHRGQSSWWGQHNSILMRRVFWNGVRRGIFAFPRGAMHPEKTAEAWELVPLQLNFAELLLQNFCFHMLFLSSPWLVGFSLHGLACCSYAIAGYLDIDLTETGSLLFRVRTTGSSAIFRSPTPGTSQHST